jgi:DNA replication protein DnaC
MRSNEIGNVIANIANHTKETIPRNEGDYIGEDGLLYCGKCHTKKQGRYKMPWGTVTPYILCKCAAEEQEAIEAAFRRAELDCQIQRYKRMGFPESEMQGWTFANDDLANEKITNAMKRYVDNFADFRKQGKGLLLYGPVGTGKTYAACEVANALIEQGRPALVTTFDRITNTLQGMFEGKQEYIDNLNQFDLLVLDDLGVERKTEYMQEMVYTIIDNRYRAGLPFIVTTNLSIEEIKKPSIVNNARIYDRILERCFPIHIEGKSRRRKTAGEDYNEMREILGL